VEIRRRPVLSHGGTLLLLLDEIMLLLHLGMVVLSVSLIDERRRMQLLLIVGWMMHLIVVAMRRFLGKLKILLMLLRMEPDETLEIFRLLRMPASCLPLQAHLLLLLAVQFLRVVVGLGEMRDR